MHVIPIYPLRKDWGWLQGLSRGAPVHERLRAWAYVSDPAYQLVTMCLNNWICMCKRALLCGDCAAMATRVEKERAVCPHRSPLFSPSLCHSDINP